MRSPTPKVNTNLDKVPNASSDLIDEGVNLAIGELTLRNASESEIREQSNNHMSKHKCQVVFVTTDQGNFIVDADNIYPYGSQGDAIAALMDLRETK